MPARDTGLHIGGLEKNLPEVNLSESESSGKPGLLPLRNCESWQAIIIHGAQMQESLGSSVLARGSWDFESTDMSYHPKHLELPEGIITLCTKT